MGWNKKRRLPTHENRINNNKPTGINTDEGGGESVDICRPIPLIDGRTRNEI